jgi:hypothetical protein
LFFTAGIGNEAHGLFGFIVAGTEEPEETPAENEDRARRGPE